MSAHQVVRWILKPAAFLASLGPLAWLVWAIETGNLSPNPLSDITNETGVWALRFLCITLAITPLRRMTGWNALVRFRRMTGLFAFFYGTLHFITYSYFDRFLSLIDYPDGVLSWDTARRLSASVVEDIGKRPFITVGFTAFVLLIPLAITSTDGMVRRLGFARWKRLHRLIYVVAVLGVVHFVWRVKSDLRQPLIFAGVLALLLAIRSLRWARATKALRPKQSMSPRRA